MSHKKSDCPISKLTWWVCRKYPSTLERKSKLSPSLHTWHWTLLPFPTRPKAGEGSKTTKAYELPVPHGELHPSFQKAACTKQIDFHAFLNTSMVTVYADFRGRERFVVQRVGGVPCWPSPHGYQDREDAVGFSPTPTLTHSLSRSHAFSFTHSLYLTHSLSHTHATSLSLSHSRSRGRLVSSLQTHLVALTH